MNKLRKYVDDMDNVKRRQIIIDWENFERSYETLRKHTKECYDLNFKIEDPIISPNMKRLVDECHRYYVRWYFANQK